MSNVTHTPGPWVFADDRGRPLGTAGHVMPDGCHVDLGEDGEAVVTDRFDSTGDVAVANARLIAAAPDLLAACKAMVRTGKAPADIDAAYDLMRAAIAKAEGRPDA